MTSEQFEKSDCKITTFFYVKIVVTLLDVFFGSGLGAWIGVQTMLGDNAKTFKTTEWDWKKARSVHRFSAGIFPRLESTECRNVPKCAGG